MAMIEDHQKRPDDSGGQVAAKVSESDESVFQQTLDGLPELARNVADRPTYFWQRQQAAIRSRIAVEEASKRPLTAFAWATGLALVLLATLIVRTDMPTFANRSQADPDQDLLVGIEHSLQNDVPEAREPAALLADEIGDAAQPSPTKNESFKEKKNAN